MAKEYKFPECLYDYKENTKLTPENIAKTKIKTLEKENKELKKNNKLLIDTLIKINDGFKTEYGHSDANRHCKCIKYWNDIIVKIFKETQNALE